MTNEELVTKIKSGELGPEGMQQLYDQNRGLILYFVKRYRSYSEEAQAKGEAQYMDLKQEAFIALYDAVEAFKPESGILFTTYAGRYILNALKKYAYRSYGMQTPDYVVQTVQYYRKAVEDFTAATGREPTDEDLIDETGDHGFMTLEAVRTARTNSERLRSVSLDAPVKSMDDEEGGSLGDLQPDPGPSVEDQVLDKVAAEELKAELWKAVDELPERQADVLRKKYREEMTGSELVEALGVSRQAINQLEHRGCEKIRESKRGKRLRSFIDARYLTRQNMVSGTSLQTWRHSGYSAPERLAIDAIEGFDDPEGEDLDTT